MFVSTSLVDERQKKQTIFEERKSSETANSLGQVQDILGILKACGGTLPRLER